MSLIGFVTAVLAGAAAGSVNRALTGGSRPPWWLASAIGVACAVAGSVVAGLAGAEAGGVPRQFMVQLCFAGIGVAVMTMRLRRSSARSAVPTNAVLPPERRR
jgi:hypothetical protein